MRRDASAVPTSHAARVRRRFWTLALPLYWLVLFAGTHYPRLRLAGLPVNSDKWLHFSAFALLALCFWQFARVRRGPLQPSFALVALAVLLPYAAIDEFSQALIPGRSADWRDWLADSTGIAVTLLLCAWRASRARPEQSDERPATSQP